MDTAIAPAGPQTATCTAPSTVPALAFAGETAETEA